jgi:hypothetical protein
VPPRCARHALHDLDETASRVVRREGGLEPAPHPLCAQSALPKVLAATRCKTGHPAKEFAPRSRTRQRLTVGLGRFRAPIACLAATRARCFASGSSSWRRATWGSTSPLRTRFGTRELSGRAACSISVGCRPGARNTRTLPEYPEGQTKRGGDSATLRLYQLRPDRVALVFDWGSTNPSGRTDEVGRFRRSRPHIYGQPFIGGLSISRAPLQASTSSSSAR